MRRTRARVQVVLELMPGAEPWLLVKHEKGHFKLPPHASVVEIWQGAVDRWGTTCPRPLASSEPTVRVRLSEWRELEALAAHVRRRPTNS
jgi:hypothetical protein